MVKSIGSLVLLLVVLSACLQHRAFAQGSPMTGLGTIYAVEQRVNDKSFFQINSTASMPSISLVANMSMLEQEQALDFPYNCYGYANGLNPMIGTFNLFAPNALAYDGQARLFFVAWDDMGDTMARLCYYNLIGKNILFVSDLVENKISGAGFDQLSYEFIYLREGRQQPEGRLRMKLVTLDRATANVRQVRAIEQWRNVTSDPNAPMAPLPFTYRAGDLAIQCDRRLYASSVGTGGGFKYFFEIFPSGLHDDFSYRLIHADPPGTALTGFATADQLAFGSLGNLISQDSDRGIFSRVNTATGANGELGVEGVDFTRFFFNGMLRTFTDLASSLDCEVDLECISIEMTSQCGGDVFLMYLPDPAGTIPCSPVERLCLLPPACVEEIECVYYVPNDMVFPDQII
ncbi:hypothetical protein FVE85_8435 [Porphyridium purpureum]|uniref:Uncharacterized protein n=1 Tax=Porphyridium purpureum TaxID=35688 RepID=A0A5J4YMR3_PORPP|nr:hypothetical protein FVE85_8435 [Porphyridium purpureum]|eukprot:POR4854..scf244_11